MRMLVGVDEAGYGPNLGPLVVAATVWEVNGEAADSAPLNRSGRTALALAAKPTVAVPNLYKLLRRAVCRVPDGRRVAIADSKLLYRAGSGLEHLERGVIAASRCVWGTASNGLAWSSMVEALLADRLQRQRELPWHECFDCPVPGTTDDTTVEKAWKLVTRVMEAAGVRLVDLRARLVFPCEFNELVEQYGNKAAALSEITLRLVREAVDDNCGLKDRPSAIPNRRSEISSTLIVCDKHGGRNRYAALVQQHFLEAWVDTLHESRAESWYRTMADGAELEFCFRALGEAFLPAALASMTAKYLRELAMRAFNEFWCARVPGLAPTAGYPSDSHRFRRAIAREQGRLGIDDRLLWRSR